MQILGDLSNQDDLELILYSMILINTVLNSIPDQDTFYDVSDAYEEQGMQRIIQHYFKNPIKDENGLFKQIVQQMELYEVYSLILYIFLSIFLIKLIYSFVFYELNFIKTFERLYRV
jgi:hypothetical protein